MNKDELLMKIQALSFAMVETQLFLDTHPDCKSALDRFGQLKNELDAAMAEYQNKYEPLFADSTSSDKWSWVEGAWPWHIGNEMASNGKAGSKSGGEKL